MRDARTGPRERRGQNSWRSSGARRAQPDYAPQPATPPRPSTELPEQLSRIKTSWCIDDRSQLPLRWSMGPPPRSRWGTQHRETSGISPIVEFANGRLGYGETVCAQSAMDMHGLTASFSGRQRPTALLRPDHEGSRMPDGPGDLALDQGAADHEPLDLVGALEDLHDLGLAHVPLGREVAGVAVAAEYLHGVRRDPHRGVRRHQLGHAGLLAVGPAGIP